MKANITNTINKVKRQYNGSKVELEELKRKKQVLINKWVRTENDEYFESYQAIDNQIAILESNVSKLSIILSAVC